LSKPDLRAYLPRKRDLECCSLRCRRAPEKVLQAFANRVVDGAWSLALGLEPKLVERHIANIQYHAELICVHARLRSLRELAEEHRKSGANSLLD